MIHRHLTRAAVAVIVALGGSAALAPPALADSVSVELHADFDSDGYADAAIGVPSENIGAIQDAGLVHILYGGPGGLGSGGSQTFQQNSPGIDPSIMDDPGPETGDRFGAALAVGDVDGNSIEDLIIGVPGEDRGLTQDSGAIHVLFGHVSGGLTGTGSITLDQELASSLSDADNEPGDQWGAALAVGRVDSDFEAEVFVGAPGEDVSVVDAGQVWVLQFDFGDFRFDTFAATQLNQGASVEGAQAAGDRFGSALAIGDLGTDAFDDLAIGVPGDEVTAIDNAGSVNVLYGSATGLSTSNDQLWNQAAPLPGGPEAGDAFGTALAVGDFNENAANVSGQFPDDLAVGTPGEDAGEGVAYVIYRNGNSLVTTGAQVWSQDTAGISEAGNPGDAFGRSLTAGDFNGDNQDDLAVGVPGEDGVNAGVGAVNVIYGDRGAALGTDNQQFLFGDNLTFGDPAETDDALGTALTNGDYNNNGESDLLITIPGEEVPGSGATSPGALNLVFGKDTFGIFGFGGLDPDDGQFLHQDSPGIPDTTEALDNFGESAR
ncbi:FG-GAP repeat protein [Acrocarpospora sp. B8E8]|uniref:FG-GAP repeat protein n=1 Tax=Acrocarpospora sp. B8E8 TaxID=3153572 RepID=UPI00325DE92A